MATRNPAKTHQLRERHLKSTIIYDRVFKHHPNGGAVCFWDFLRPSTVCLTLLVVIVRKFCRVSQQNFVNFLWKKSQGASSISGGGNDVIHPRALEWLSNLFPMIFRSTKISGRLSPWWKSAGAEFFFWCEVFNKLLFVFGFAQMASGHPTIQSSRVSEARSNAKESRCWYGGG